MGNNHKIIECKIPSWLDDTTSHYIYNKWGLTEYKEPLLVALAKDKILRR